MKDGIETEAGLDGKVRIWTHNGIVEGKWHRTSGPAVVTEGHYSWYLNGFKVYSWDELQFSAELNNEDMLVLRLKYPMFDRI